MSTTGLEASRTSSTSATEVREHLASLGFSPVLERPVPVRLFGLLGSGCSEYVYRKSVS